MVSANHASSQLRADLKFMWTEICCCSSDQSDKLSLGADSLNCLQALASKRVVIFCVNSNLNLSYSLFRTHVIPSSCTTVCLPEII